MHKAPGPALERHMGRGRTNPEAIERGRSAMERTDQISQEPTPHASFSWGDDDNEPAIPRIPRPRTPQAGAR
jgi:hypothetical protein